MRFSSSPEEKEQEGDTAGFNEFCRHWSDQEYIHTLINGKLAEVPASIDEDIKRKVTTLIENISTTINKRSLVDIAHIDEGEKWIFRTTALYYNSQSLIILTTMDMTIADRNMQRKYYDAVLTVVALARINKAMGYRKIDLVQEE